MSLPPIDTRLTSISALAPGAHTQPLQTPSLEELLSGVEGALTELGLALRRRDPAGVEEHAEGLRDSLQFALEGFSLAARQGAVPTPLRARLMRVGGQVAEQRESLARATFALDHAIDAMMPRDVAGVYSAKRTPAHRTPPQQNYLS